MAETMYLTKQVLANIYRQLRNFIANLIFLANTLNPSLKQSLTQKKFCLCRLLPLLFIHWYYREKTIYTIQWRCTPTEHGKLSL